MCVGELEKQRDIVLGQKGKNELQKFQAEEAICEGTQMQLEYSEWGSQVGDGAAETSMNLIMQGHASSMPCREGNGEPRRIFKEGIFFCKKRSLWHQCGNGGNESIHQ